MGQDDGKFGKKARGLNNCEEKMNAIARNFGSQSADSASTFLYSMNRNRGHHALNTSVVIQF